MTEQPSPTDLHGSWDPKRPYQSLPNLPPAGMDLETKPILKRCIAARSALAELKAAAGLIPNDSILISILPTLESQASSEIENIVTTADRLFQFGQIEDKADPATKEALKYARALRAGFESLDVHPLNTRTSERVCSMIKGTEMSVRRVPGTELINRATKEVIYTPPVGESLLRDLLSDWERFLHDQPDLDPLIRMAVGHYQFEAIHPFTDGNGRTGRILNNLFLVQQSLLTSPILYLSRYLIANKDDYYRLLLSVTRDGAWAEWILFILNGIEETSTWTKLKITGIRMLMAHTSSYVKAKAPKIYSHELISLIFELPYCRIQNLSDRSIAERQSASRYLHALTDLGILREIKIGREKLFIHPKMMNLLSDDLHRFEEYEANF